MTKENDKIVRDIDAIYQGVGYSWDPLSDAGRKFTEARFSGTQDRTYINGVLIMESDYFYPIAFAAVIDYGLSVYINGLPLIPYNEIEARGFKLGEQNYYVIPTDADRADLEEVA